MRTESQRLSCKRALQKRLYSAKKRPIILSSDAATDEYARHIEECAPNHRDSFAKEPHKRDYTLQKRPMRTKSQRLEPSTLTVTSCQQTQYSKAYIYIYVAQKYTVCV